MAVSVHHAHALARPLVPFLALDGAAAAAADADLALDFRL